MNAFLPDGTRIGWVQLRTANLERALGFYREVLGFEVVNQSGHLAALGVGSQGPKLIVLSEVPGAPRCPARATGLFHFAIRYPSRRDLARACRRLQHHRYPIAGASDHGVSEAIYLSDPDGNGLELYSDRPRPQWPYEHGQLAMLSGPIDFGALLAAAGKDSGAAPPPQTDIGHIHLHVADLAAAEQFYHDFLGLAVTQRSYPGALFFGAGGYHHHVAVNTWAGTAVPPAEAVGLLSYQLAVPLNEVLYCLRHRAPLLGYETKSDTRAGKSLEVRDPNGAWLEISAATASVDAPQPA